ncbi:hypothetical protein [Microbacterium sp. NPDC064584]|uniref:hypothetical protein n=1 Tax=Microbacterium sp. NPDC064584 TaxID=3155817 RepID=UPI003419AEBC
MLHLSVGTRSAARTAAALIAVVLLVGLTLFWPADARAASDDDQQVRWSVVPADDAGPDGRRAVEVELDPGEVVQDHFAVRNIGSDEVVFALTAADGFTTRTGRFDILPADEQSVDAGTWISLPETVTVPGDSTVVVPFSIIVPDQAEPGDHAAGITASVLSVRTAEDGTSVGVDSRIGFRVLTRVTGEIAPAAALADLVGGYAISWNPLRPGEATVSFDVVNEGNTRLMAEGSVSAGGRTVFFPGPGESPQEMLPGDTRRITVVLDDVWPLVAVPATVTATPTVVTYSGEEAVVDAATGDLVVWALPIPQAIVLAGIALILTAMMWGRRRSRRRLDQLLESAREEGRRAAAKELV